MRHSRLLLPAALGAALLVPSAASAATTTLHGTVVKRGAKAFVVAGASGRLSLVHASHAPRARHAVTVRARRLSDGTYRASRVHAGAVRSSARVRGTVGFRSHRSFSVVAHGAEVRVTTKRRVSAAPGSRVSLRVRLEDHGDLAAGRVDDTGDDTDGFELEGRVAAIDTTVHTLTIADEDGSGTLTLSVPDSLDLTGIEVGDRIEVDVTQQDGALVVVQVDDRGDHADRDDDADEDHGEDQADENDHRGRGREHGDDRGDDRGDDDDRGHDDSSGSGGRSGDDSSGSEGGGDDA